MVAARYYDGCSARSTEVDLSLDGETLVVRGDGVERREALREISIGSRIGNAPRTLQFADRAICEVRDHAGFDALLRQAGGRPNWLHGAERNVRLIVFSIVIILAVAAAFVVWGVPAGAQWFANAMPPRLVQALSERTLDLLDRHALKASALPPQRIVDLMRGIEALRAPQGTPAIRRLEFRAAPGWGANAFALPDGTIVLLDELVALADNDEQIFAVVGHELGHVHHRHGLRLMAQNSAIGMLAVWWFGDVSTVLAAAPTIVMQAHYSRGFELEADQYAAAFMRANDIAPSRLMEMLAKLVAQRASADDEDEATSRGWLASHPDLQERAQALDGERGR